MRVLRSLTMICALALAACHGQPVVDTTPHVSVGGTIAGIVSTDANQSVTGRKVTAIEVNTNARFEATTGLNGGYTIKVPEGTFRIELELHEGEAVVKQPEPTKINNSDLDSHRDFVVGAKRE